MCLIIDEQNAKLKIANEDIVCYKLVKKVEQVDTIKQRSAVVILR